MAKQTRAALISSDDGTVDTPRLLATLVSGTNKDGTAFALEITLGSADTLVAGGQATQPAAGAAIATVAAPGAGVYFVEVTTVQAGTVDPLTPANMELRHGATVVGKLLSAGSAAVHKIPRLTIAGAEAITVNATAQPAASAIYAASIRATRVE